MFKSKIVKILWIIAMVITQVLSITSKVQAANIGESKDLERGELGYYCVQKWNGSSWIYLTYNQTFYTDTDGQKYIAYCLSPGLPGVGYVAGEQETYQVKINEIMNNNVVWRVLKNGYPNKSVEELGLETADDAYFATMQAINAILRGYSLEQAKELYSPGQFAINGESLEDIQRRGNKTLNVMYNLMDIGLNGTETREQFLNISVEKVSELKKENSEYYSQTFKVQSQSEVSEFSIEKLEGLPKGSFIADLKGNKKDNFSGGEQFKVMIPKNNIQNDIKGKISIKAKQKNYPIYYGASTIEGHQDYALCNNSYSEVYANQEIYAPTDKSKLVIKKVDSDTKAPIKGVKFQITGTDGVSNTYTTDANGKITIANQRPGKVTIKEIKSVGKYKINPEATTVELKYNEIKEIELENELQKGSIKIVKTDKENNKIKLAGVKFQLKDENNNVIKEGITDKNGELIFENVIIGKYKIVELQAKEGYVPLDKEIVVNVVNGEVQKLNIENEKIVEKPQEPEKTETPKKTEEPKEADTPKKVEEVKVVKEINVVKEEKKVVEVVEEKKLPKTGSEANFANNVGNILIIGVGSVGVILRKFVNM
ncbi:MAG: Cys-Gln thioester bond-forming surface protein [Clostridia bacterium]|nr:Cys-Gln thioester bond-forming surface protein [Clostridia bacterium]